jgi:hypothetical protein
MAEAVISPHGWFSGKAAVRTRRPLLPVCEGESEPRKPFKRESESG